MSPVQWPKVKTALLDMDGTLLDRHFDDHFYLETVPHAFAEAQKMALEKARHTVLAAYRKAEGTLAWYDIDYWSNTLKLDIPALKKGDAHRIQPRPQAMALLAFLKQAGLSIHLVTDAHPRSLNLKLEHVDLRPHFHSIITSHQIGLPKMEPAFWSRLQEIIGFDPATTLMVDDSEKVLAAAETFGIAHLLHMAHPSSDLAPQRSERFPSVHCFSEAMTPPSR
ncbi:MAG: GMP/IMP nucleotidase [Magnetococcales bacterium]|nr:GMP/IMP nucleotidase [Magnetococcales bacterium]